ncbi:MAG: phosphatase PAP2 family protein [Saprospiraceae bacterium]|nr:phosphatase PAP2 family protein [Saprospiraceae bacterium]
MHLRFFFLSLTLLLPWLSSGQAYATYIHSANNIGPTTTQYVNAAGIDSAIMRPPNKYNWAKFALPVALTGYGYLSLKVQYLQNWDNQVRKAVMGTTHTKIDDYIIYTPLLADIGLSLGGYASAHKIRDKAALYMMSTALNAAMVYPVKKLTTRLRPDESDLKSFPSGHTSNAFVAAEYFWQEYKGRSRWLAASGYVIAATTGYLRMHNDRHWFSDVIAGAGIGMLSTKLVFALYPSLQKIVFPSSSGLGVTPIVSGPYYGVFLTYNWH